jgi:hypothetical protein
LSSFGSWARSYEPDRGASRDAFGEIAIYMQAATHEQLAAVRAWLKEFKPARDVPATHLLPRTMEVAHHHGSTAV